MSEGAEVLYTAFWLVLWVIRNREWIIAIVLLRECEGLLGDWNLATVCRDDLSQRRIKHEIL